MIRCRGLSGLHARGAISARCRCRETEELIGIVTDRDVRQVAPAYPLLRDEDEIRRYTEKLTVTAAMTADPITIGPDVP